MISPKLEKLSDGSILTTNIVNSLINRIEYAADLLRQYKLIAGEEAYIEPHYDGTRVSFGSPVGGGATPRDTGGIAVPAIYVSVVDEDDNVSLSFLQEQASVFVETYGRIPLYVLIPTDPEGRGVKIQAYDLAIPTSVQRDDGNAGLASDWFSILPAAKVYNVKIDNSGSMTTETVQASLNLFISRAQNAKRTVIWGEKFNEDWIGYHL